MKATKENAEKLAERVFIIEGSLAPVFKPLQIKAIWASHKKRKTETYRSRCKFAYVHLMAINMMEGENDRQTKDDAIGETPGDGSGGSAGTD